MADMERIFNNIINNDSQELSKQYITYKSIINLKENIFIKLSYFNKKVGKLKHKSQVNYSLENRESTNSIGLLDIFNELLKEDNQKSKLEEEQERYRNAIIEKNLSEGKMFEDLYDELNGDNLK